MEGKVMEKKNKGTLIAAILFLGMLAGNYFQYQLSPIAGRIIAEYGLTEPQFSRVFTAPMVSAVLLSIVAGVLTDKLGVKKVVGVALAIAAAGLCGRIFASGYTSLFVTMFCAGIGTTFLNVNTSKILAAYFPPEKLSGMVGIVILGSTIGMSFATATTAAFPSTRLAFIVAAVISVLAFAAWVFGMESSKRDNAGTDAGGNLIEDIKTVMKCRAIWLIGVCLMCVLGCNTALSSFIPVALQSKGISEASSGIAVTGLMIGSLLGTIIGPQVVQKMSIKRPAIIVLGLLAAVTATFAWRSTSIALVFILLLFAGFGMGSLLPLFMSMPVKLPEIGFRYAGTAGGVVSTIELIGAVAIPSYIITPIAAGNYNTYFLMTGAVMVIMAIVALFLPEV